MVASKFSRLVEKLFYTDGMNRLPFGTVTVVFIATFLCEVSSTMCYSYLPKMVKSFGISEVDSGYRVGLLASSVNFGWGVFGMVWGKAGDVYGYKSVLVLASVGAMAASLLFGFSTTYEWALMSRCVHGMFMGMTVVGKSILVKVSDHTNRVLAFSLFYSAWTLAFVIGPSVSGVFVFPADQYPDIFDGDSMFKKYGVLLPNLILVVCWLVVIALEVLIIPNNFQKTNGENIPLLDNVDETTCGTTFGSEPISDRPTLLHEIMRRDFMACIFLYLVVGFIMAGIEEMFPVYAATAHLYNGLQLSTSEIGLLLLASGLLLLLGQTLVGPKLTHRFGTQCLFISSSCCLVVLIPLTPLCSFLQRKSETMVLFVIVTGLCLYSSNVMLVQINVLINNSITPNITGFLH